MRYSGCLIAVCDMAASRRFYEDLFDQRVLFDFGENVAFESGISLQGKSSWANFLQVGEDEIETKSHWGELYFEHDDLEGFREKLLAYGGTLVHDMVEYPWGQRTMRLYDPDGHVIELGESMEHVIRRFLAEGLTPEETALKTQHPIEFVLRYKESQLRGKLAN